MSQLQLTGTTKLIVTNCWCGIMHGVPESLYRLAERDHSHTVYCPLGHEWVVAGPTEAQKLKEKLRWEQERREATSALLRQEERSHAATKGHLTRNKKRIAHGICPCCNRSFAQLERHMASKHPEFVAAVTE